MKFEEYIEKLPSKRKLSEVKFKILKRLWGTDDNKFPKPWVSSAELLELTGQKYFDRRTRELRDQMGCDLEAAYQEKFSGHAWRISSSKLAVPQDRDYLTQSQKIKLFEESGYCCVTCGLKVDAGIRGLQADHKVPISRGGSNSLDNWQPMCNNCNVGKRRACEGCSLECDTCSWAFPELVGVKGRSI
jgi:5-methylcytosine-specific restriction endonuclease McrA